jgi:dihydrodipicolinate synthase/N-acetylneuraminate lyase
MKITPDDIRGVFGILPAPATPDAESWSATSTINFSETERMVGIVNRAGVEIISTTGTFGEGATLTLDELIDFTRCVAQANAKSRPYFAGVTTLNTRDTITRGRLLIEAGADGLFVGRPMWLAMDEQAIVRYYRDIAEALPSVPLIVYDNQVAFKGKISQAAYQALAELPEVVGAKHTGGPLLESDMVAVGRAMRILPPAGSWNQVAERQPDLALSGWAGSVACAPEPVVRLAKAIAARDWIIAEEVGSKMRWAESAMMPGGDLVRFMDYSIPIAHLRFKHAGLIDPGPPRPPYLFLPDEYRDGGIECGRRWAQLQAEYSAVTASA